MKQGLSPKKTIIACLLLLNVLSLLSIYSGLHQYGGAGEKIIFYRQIRWIAVSWLLLIIFSFIHYRFYYNFSFALYGLSLALLLAVILFGKEAMGAQRWLALGGLTFQPSEISKVATIFILATCLTAADKNSFLKAVLFPFFLVTLSAALIFKQPDLGTGIILIVFFLIIEFFSATNKKYLTVFICLGIFFLPLAWSHLKDYQKKRLVVFLNPDLEPLGAGYTIIQSKVAVGSGKILGRGFLSGTQNQFNFLPERHTDFIFTIIAEEWGFLGSLFLILIYWLILKKILEVSRELKDPFAQLLSSGIGLFFFLHVFINIGMTLGILPVVGLPLTFLSYGGTHLAVSFILIGIFFNICRNHT